MTTVDATVLWLRSLAARLAHLGRQLTSAERVLLAVLIVASIIAGLSVVLFPSLQHVAVLGATVVVAAVLAPAVIADAVIMRENLRRSGAAMVKINATKSTGAPRVAEVRCKHGDPHRFVYGPSGWEAAGPGVIPEPEEATAP